MYILLCGYPPFRWDRPLIQSLIIVSFEIPKSSIHFNIKHSIDVCLLAETVGMNADGLQAVHVTLASWTYSRTFKMGNMSSTSASGEPSLLRRRVSSWSCWWRRQSADSLRATCCNTLGWATTTLLSWRPAPGSGRTTRLESFRCLQNQPPQWTGWCSSTCPSTWGCGSRRATSPASLRHQSLVSCNAASLSTTPSHSNWTESALPAPRSYPSRCEPVYSSHYVVNFPDWFVQDLIGPVPIASPSCWILYVAAVGLHHLYTSLLLCQRPSGAHLAPNYTSGGSGYITTCETELWLCYIRAPLSILWKCKTTFISGVDLYDYDMRCHSAIEMKIIFLFFEENYISKGRGWVLLFAV